MKDSQAELAWVARLYKDNIPLNSHYLSTNPAQCQVTLLMKTNDVTTHQADVIHKLG